MLKISTSTKHYKGASQQNLNYFGGKSITEMGLEDLWAFSRIYNMMCVMGQLSTQFSLKAHIFWLFLVLL